MKKQQDIFKFHRGTSDLAPGDFSWVGKSFAQCKEEIELRCLRLTHHLPGKNMWYIRYCTFPISETTTMDQLKKLGEEIRTEFGIDCFQISLYRDKHEATFLFNFYSEKDRNNTVFINNSDMIYLYILGLRRLGLASSLVPQDRLRYVLVSAYKDNNRAFRDLLETIRRTSIGKADYELVSICLRYIENNVKGLIK